MATLTQQAPTVKAGCTCRLHLTIGETTYAVKPLPCDPCLGSRAFRLRKPDGTTYDLIQGEWGPACDCPAATFRDDRPCKHARALVACGLLEAGHGDAWEPGPDTEAPAEPEAPAVAPAAAPAEVDALRWASSISRLWSVATEEQRAAAAAIHNCDSGTLGRRIVPPGPSVAELEALAATTPRTRTLCCKAVGAHDTMTSLGWSLADGPGGWYRKVVAEPGPALSRTANLSDYDARRWNR